MPGLGDGPFGQEPFGRWKWSRQVLFDLLPGLYKDQDAQNGGVLEQWSEALRLPFENLRSKIETFGELRDPLRVRTQYDQITRIRLGSSKTIEGRTLQRGVDGVVSAARNFSSVTARFTQQDRGRSLRLAGSGVSINNRTFFISAVLNTTTVRCDPPLVVDAGPLAWLVLDLSEQLTNSVLVDVRGGDISDITPGWLLSDGESEFTVVGRQQFFPITEERKSLTEREGLLGSAGVTGTFIADLPFTQKDVGKKLTIFDSSFATNNGKYEIYAVNPASPAIVTLWKSVTVPGADANGGIVYSIAAGQYGITVSHVVAGLSTVLSVSVSDTSAVVNLATDVGGVATSTANQVVAALAASSATALLIATVTGTGLGLAGATAAVALPGVKLLTDTGPIAWALLPFPQLELSGTALPKGVIEQEGVEGSVVPSNSFSAVTAQFTADDVGKLLRITGSTLGNDGDYEVVTVTNTAQLILTPSLPFISESGLCWDLRIKSRLGDFTQADASAPSLIQYLAQDFGIEIDTRESEPRQRSWVENVTQWLDLKGTEKAYEIIGAISGFDVSVSALYRIDAAVAPSIDGADLFQLGEDGAARSGTDGRLFSVFGLNQFYALSAAFTPADVGSLISIGNAQNPFNNALHEIGAYIDEHTVAFVPTDSAITPDVGLGVTLVRPYGLGWSVVRLYADRPPLRPNFDEINVDLMQSIVGTFLIDSYCWDDANLTLSMPMNILSAVGASVVGGPVMFLVTAEGVGLGPAFTSCAVVTAVGSWKITDSAGNGFFLETIPVELAPGPPAQHTFQVFAAVAPVVGSAVLRYVCTPQYSCGYCKSYRVRAVIEEASISEELGVARERVLERVIDRLINEVKPAHVELLPVFRTTIDISAIQLLVTITTPP